MHILVIPSWYPTSNSDVIGIFFREQTIALKKHGYQVGVISPCQYRLKKLFKGIPNNLYQTQYENDYGVPTYRYYTIGYLPHIPYGNSSLWLKIGLKLFKTYITNHGKPDIIHAHSALMGGVLARKIKKKYSISYIITEHGSTYARNLLSDWQLELAKLAFQNANERIVVSPALGRLLEKTLGNSFSSWQWIPNILDNRFTISAEKIKSKSQSFQFLNIALMTENKGQADLLQAFAQAFKGKSDIQLRLGGDGIIRPQLEKLVSELEIADQVVFLGLLSRDQVLEEMQTCDAFVLSSHYETFGVVLIEALACGKPVIATACGGPECIVKEHNGFLVSPQNSKELGQVMLKLVQKINDFNPEDIRIDCLQRFSADPVIRQLSEIYNEIKQRKIQA